MKRKIRQDVQWYAPDRKKPIAESTVATSDLIVAIMEIGDTISDLREKVVYDVEAKMVLDAYIGKGYGDQVASEWFR